MRGKYTLDTYLKHSYDSLETPLDHPCTIHWTTLAHPFMSHLLYCNSTFIFIFCFGCYRKVHNPKTSPPSARVAAMRSMQQLFVKFS